MLQNINTIQKEEEKLNINKGILNKGIFASVIREVPKYIYPKGYIRDEDETRYDNLKYGFINNRKEDHINFITGPMGIGKTFATYKDYIPLLIADGATKIVVAAPERMIIKMGSEKYWQDVTNAGAKLYDEPTDINSWSVFDGLSVILLTQSAINSNFSKIHKTQSDVGKNKFALISDEAHYGATTSLENYENNIGYKFDKNNPPGLVYAKNLITLAEGNKNIIGLTATPVHEMLDKTSALLGYNPGDENYDDVESILTRKNKYHSCNQPGYWPVGRELLSFSAQCGGITLVPKWMAKGGHTDAAVIRTLLEDPQKGLIKHMKDTDFHYENVLTQAANTPHFDYFKEKLNPRVITQIVCGQDASNTDNGYSDNSKSIDEMQLILLSELRKHRSVFVDENKYCILVNTSKEISVQNIKGKKMLINEEDIPNLLRKPDERNNIDIRFLLVINKMVMGFDEANIKFGAAVRARKMTVDVTPQIIQIIGRCTRIFYGTKGVDNRKDLRVLDAKLTDFPSLQSAYHQYAMHMNTMFYFAPDESNYQKAKEEFLEKFICSENQDLGTCVCSQTCNDPLCKSKINA